MWEIWIFGKMFHGELMKVKYNIVNQSRDEKMAKKSEKEHGNLSC